MGRIIGYQYDDNVQDGDAWIGSEDGGGRTKQYTAEAVANYLNIQGKISIVGQMTYEYVVGPQGGIGTFSLFGGGTSPVAFSSITKLTYSNTDKGGQRVVEFLNLLVGSDVLIAKQNEISTFGYYTVDSYTVNASDSSYYDLAVTFKAGNGAMTFLEIYDVQNFVLANDATQSPWEIVADGINYPDGNVGIGITNSEDYFNIEKTDTLNSITRGSQVTLTKNNTTGTDFAAGLYGFRSLVSNTSSGNVGYVQGSTDNARHSGTGDMYVMIGSAATAKHEGSGNANGVYGSYFSGQALGTGTTSINFLVGDVINATLNNPNATVQKYHGINNQLFFSAGTVTEEAAVALLDIDSNAAAIINGDFSYLYIKQNSVYPTISGDARSIYSNSILPSTFTGSVSIGKSALPTNALEVLGNVKFDSYGSGTITGTPTQRLGVDASGNVIEIPIGSGAVDGAGTTNFVTKWLDTDTVGDSVIFDNGTNVGIGTTNPGYKLEIDGTLKSTGRSYLATNGPSSVVQIGGSNSTITQLNLLSSAVGGSYIAATNSFAINVDNSTSVKILPNGNFGIGTTSPTQDLTLYKSSGDTNFLISSNNGASQIFFGDTESDNIGKIDYDHSDNSLNFVVNAAERMRITSTGNVGIGTTSPTNKLDIRQSTSGGSDVLGTGAITIGSDNPYWAFRGTATSLQDLAFDRSYAGTWYESMRIQRSTGNVGIGTTSPGAKLEVKNSTVSSYAIQFISSNNNPLGGMYEDVSTNGEFYVKNSSAVSAIKLDSAGNSYLNGGNVGIGTTNPSRLLDVDGIQGWSLNNAEVAYINPTATGTDFALKQLGVTVIRLDGRTNANSYFNAGNVGIGTTSPSEKLEVAGNVKVSNGTSNISIIPNNSNGSISITSQSVQGALVSAVLDGFTFASRAIYGGVNIGSFNNAGTVTLGAFGYGNVNYQTAHNSFAHTWYGSRASNPWMTLNSTGLGIGTTSPSQKLEVDGQVLSDGYRLAAMQTAPATRNSTGTLGEIVIDGNHIYVCYATDSWSRVALDTSW